MNVYHEGAIIFVLIITCIVSALVVYDWVGFLVRKFLLKGSIVAGDSTAASQVGFCLDDILYHFSFSSSRLFFFVNTTCASNIWRL